MPLIDALVTNFDNGINNRTQGSSIFGSMKQLDPTRFHNYFEDFDYYLAADWTVTEIGTATQALEDTDGGNLLITNDVNDNDSSFQQKIGESFLFELGKSLYFKSRLSMNDATQSLMIMGLQITDTTPVDATDGVYFVKADEVATVSLIIRKGGVGITVANFTTMADDTFIELSYFWDGIDMIWAGVNDAPVVRTAVNSNLPDDQELTISFGVENGEAASKTMSVDYIFVAKER